MYEKKIISEYKSCGLGITMEVIGGKHKPCLIQSINKGIQRPSELHKEHPHVSPRVLNQQLSELEQYGIVRKKIYPVLPPKVEYTLTDFGLTLLPIIKSMEKWGLNYEDTFRVLHEKRRRKILKQA